MADIKKQLQEFINQKKKEREGQDKISRERLEEDRKAIVASVGKDLAESLKPVLESLPESAKVSSKQIRDAFSEAISINMPEIPPAEVNIPDIRVDTKNIEKAVREAMKGIQIPAPVVNVPETVVNIPDSVRADIGVSRKKPMPVTMVDFQGNPLSFPVVGGGGGGKADFFTIKGIQGSAWGNVLNADGRLRVETNDSGSGSGTTEVRQVSGAVDSTNVIQLGGTSIATNEGELTDGTMRIAFATDAIASVNIVSGSSTGTEYDDGDGDDTPTGAVAMGFDNNERLFALRTHSGVVNSGVLRVVHATDVGLSTSASQNGTWNINTVTDVTNSVKVETLPETLQTQLNSIETDTSTLAGAVSGSEMQVDIVGPLPSGTNAIGKLAANSGVDIGDVDVTSVTPGTGASNLGKAEDAAHTTGDVGVMPLAVRNDALASLAGTDGDYTPLQVDADGALYVIEKNKIDSNNSTTSTLTSDFAFTGTGTEILQYSAVSVFIEASHDSATDGMSFQWSTDNSNWDLQETVSYDASDGAISYVLPVKAQYFRVVYTNGSTGQTHFRLETILHANNMVPTDGRLSDSVSPEKIGAITKSAIIAQASGAGDFVPIQSTNGGSLKISLEEAEGLAGQATMANSVPVVIASDQSDIEIVGNVANDAADSGNPIKVGGVARTSNPTAVAGGDRVNASFDDIGRQITRPIQVRDLISTAYTSLSNGTETSLLAGVSGEFHDLVWVMGANQSDAAVTVDFRASTGGAVIMTLEIPANATAGIAPPVPYPQHFADASWTADMEDITGTTVDITALFSKEV